MAQPIYKFFMARFSEAWYQLSEEEQKSFEAKLDEALEKASPRERDLGRSFSDPIGDSGLTRSGR